MPSSPKPQILSSCCSAGRSGAGQVRTGSLGHSEGTFFPPACTLVGLASVFPGGEAVKLPVLMDGEQLMTAPGIVCAWCGWVLPSDAKLHLPEARKQIFTQT